MAMTSGYRLRSSVFGNSWTNFGTTNIQRPSRGCSPTPLTTTKLTRFWCIRSSGEFFVINVASIGSGHSYHNCFLLYIYYFCRSCESRSNRREPVHGGRTPSAPLSPAAQRLLKEFGLRYGVVRTGTRIVCVLFHSFVTCYSVGLNFRESSFAGWSTWTTWQSSCTYIFT